MLELHVYGPGFGLPSIDPQCLAAIAYLNITLPKNSWTLLPSNNPHLSPSKSLPALRSGSTWLTTLPAIFCYIRQHSPHTDPDSILEPHEVADLTAFTAYVTARVGELIDLSLYVSYPNFEAVTRPKWAQILPFPVSYWLPIQMRAAAHARTSHLGFGKSLDCSTILTPSSLSQHSAVDIPSAPPKNTPQLESTAAVIRLNTLYDEVLGTLARRLGNDKYFFGNAEDTSCSSLDCIAVAYLALLDAPNEFPALCAREKLRSVADGRLAKYVQGARIILFGNEDEKGGSSLPWGKVERGDLAWFVGVVAHAAKEALIPTSLWPMTGAQVVEKEEVDENPMMEERKRKAREKRRREWWKSVGFVASGVLGIVGYMVWSGVVLLPALHGEAMESIPDDRAVEGVRIEEVRVDADADDADDDGNV